METKREKLIDALERALVRAKNKDAKSLERVIGGVDIDVFFDDEQPKIMNAEEIYETLVITKDSNITISKGQVICLIKNGIKEGKKCFQPLVDRIKLDSSISLTKTEYLLSLIIKEQWPK